MNQSQPAVTQQAGLASSEPTGASQAQLSEPRTDFSAVYEAHFAFVWRNLLRLGVRGPELDDAVQEVFIVVHRKLGALDLQCSMRAWIFGILKHVARLYRRTRARKEPPSVGDAERIADIESLQADERLERNEAIAALEFLLDSMQEAQREVFILVELEQMNGPEIAEALSISVNTVYSRLRAAREHFQQGALRLCARMRSRP